MVVTLMQMMKTQVQEVRRQYVGPVFKRWRSEGRTLTFLAEKMDVDLQTLSGWHTGRRGIPELYLRRLCIEAGFDRALLGERPYSFVERGRKLRKSA